MNRLIDAKADFHQCGAGQRHACCAYLLAGPEGAECGREQSMKKYIEARVARGEMNAQRLPDAHWPDCMIFPSMEKSHD